MANHRNLLAEFHKRASEHHAAIAAHLDKCIAKTRSVKPKQEAAPDASGLEDVAEAMAAEHRAMSDFHAEQADKCAKAEDGEMFKADSTSQVFRLALPAGEEENPMGKPPAFMTKSDDGTGQRIASVERAGQPKPKDRQKGTAQLPIELLHLRKVLSAPESENLEAEADARA